MLSIASLFLYSVPLALIGLFAATPVGAYGMQIFTTYWEIRCEAGMVSYRSRGWLTGDEIHQIARVLKIAVQVFSRGPRAYTYVDVAEPEAQRPGPNEGPVVEGLAIYHHDRKDLLEVGDDFELVLWAGRALLEGAKAQGCYGEVDT